MPDSRPLSQLGDRPCGRCNGTGMISRDFEIGGIDYACGHCGGTGTRGGFWENGGDELTIEVGAPDYTEDGPPRRFVEIDLMSGHCCARLTSDQARQAALVLLAAAKELERDA